MLYWFHVAGTFLMRFIPVDIAYRLVGGATPLVLTGANTYTGPTTINAGGTLQVGNGGATGSGGLLMTTRWLYPKATVPDTGSVAPTR